MHETTKFTLAMLMFGRKLHIPLDLLIGCPQEEPEDRGYPEYKRFRESVETVHNFACVHQQEGSLRMKRRYDMRIVASAFGSGDLVWLHNPQRKKGISPKLRLSGTQRPPLEVIWGRTHRLPPGTNARQE